MSENKPTLEKSLKEMSDQLAVMQAKLDSMENGKKNEKPNETEVLLSPRLKRKIEKPISESDEDCSNICKFFSCFNKWLRILCKGTQKDFTNQLRKKLKEKFPEHPNETIGFYQKKNNDVLIEIKSIFAQKKR